MSAIAIPNKELFWPSEVAKILGISRSTVYRRIEDGTISTHLPCHPLKVSRAALVDFLSQSSQ